MIRRITSRPATPAVLAVFIFVSVGALAADAAGGQRDPKRPDGRPLACNSTSGTQGGSDPTGISTACDSFQMLLPRTVGGVNGGRRSPHTTIAGHRRGGDSNKPGLHASASPAICLLTR